MSAASASASASRPPMEARTEWPARRIRQTFMSYLDSNPHARWPLSPVVPVDGLTLLFANVGMNQFKPVFLGTTVPHSPRGRLRHGCNTQKCIRASGKHNGLDDVGKDTYHHTFFKMLGNWFFGDYFKPKAIGFAWKKLLTKIGQAKKGCIW